MLGAQSEAICKSGRFMSMRFCFSLLQLPEAVNKQYTDQKNDKSLSSEASLFNLHSQHNLYRKQILIDSKAFRETERGLLCFLLSVNLSSKSVGKQ